MPFACQILRGTAGTYPGCDQDSNIAPSQVTAATAAKKPELPNLMAKASWLRVDGTGNVLEAGGGAARHTRE